MLSLPPITASCSTPSRHIDLLRGWPAPPLLPSLQIADSTARVLSNPDISVPALEYGPDMGFTLLRTGLASWLSAHYGVHPPGPERICISAGASQSIASILQCFTDPHVTKAIWLVAPVYYLVCPIFEDSGFSGRLRAVPEGDEGGLDILWLEKRLQEMGGQEDVLKPFKPTDPLRKLYRHVIYCVPSSSNPSGKTMSLHQRHDLVRLARKHDALVICDDVYDMLQWEVPHATASPSLDRLAKVPFPETCRLPRLVDIDLSLGHPPCSPSQQLSATNSEPNPQLLQQQQQPLWFGNAISNGSFSKLICPGMRTGWVEGTPSFSLGLSRTGSTRSGGGPSQLCAAIIHDMLDTGTLDTIISTRTRPALQHKHSVLLNSLSSIQSKGVAWKLAERTPATYGGYFVWLVLPPGVSAAAVAKMAQDEQNLTISPGNMFRVLGDESAACFDGHIRLCFAWEDEEGIREGVERLGKVVARLSVDSSQGL